MRPQVGRPYDCSLLGSFGAVAVAEVAAPVGADVTVAAAENALLGLVAESAPRHLCQGVGLLRLVVHRTNRTAPP